MVNAIDRREVEVYLRLDSVKVKSTGPLAIDGDGARLDSLVPLWETRTHLCEEWAMTQQDRKREHAFDQFFQRLLDMPVPECWESGRNVNPNVLAFKPVGLFVGLRSVHATVGLVDFVSFRVCVHRAVRSRMYQTWIGCPFCSVQFWF